MLSKDSEKKRLNPNFPMGILIGEKTTIKQLFSPDLSIYCNKITRGREGFSRAECHQQCEACLLHNGSGLFLHPSTIPQGYDV